MDSTNAEKFWLATQGYKGFVLTLTAEGAGWHAQYRNTRGDIATGEGLSRQLAILEAQVSVDMLLEEGD